jgi:hypothetical protein
LNPSLNENSKHPTDYLLLSRIALDKPLAREHIQVFVFSFFYSYVLTMFELFLPLSPHPSFTYPTPSLFPFIPSLPGRNYFALISNFVEERI